MRNRNSLLFAALLTLVLVEPAMARGGGGGGGGGHGGSFGSGRMGGSAMRSVHEPFRGGDERRDFRRGFFGGGYAWGYDDPYGYDSDETTIEQAPPVDNYDESMRAQDEQRTKLPTSAFVKNYNWPNTSNNLADQSKLRSVASSHSVSKSKSL